jgi:hypothetical protein
MLTFTTSAVYSLALTKTSLRIYFMNSNTDDQSRQDLEAKLDRILREPENRSVNSELKQPEPVTTPKVDTSMLEPAVDQPEFAKKSKPEPFSHYLKHVSASVFQALRSSRTWLKSLAKRTKKIDLRKISGKLSNLFPKLRKLPGSRVSKMSVILISGIGVVIAILLTVLVNFTYLTVSGGIDTTLGSAENRTVLTLKASDANPGDLLVASLGIDSETNQEILVIGTVFSKNDETYALYDGEVIWQITSEQIRGIVLFAEATEAP